MRRSRRNGALTAPSVRYRTYRHDVIPESVRRRGPAAYVFDGRVAIARFRESRAASDRYRNMATLRAFFGVRLQSPRLAFFTQWHGARSPSKRVSRANRPSCNMPMTTTHVTDRRRSRSARAFPQRRAGDAHPGTAIGDLSRIVERGLQVLKTNLAQHCCDATHDEEWEGAWTRLESAWETVRSGLSTIQSQILRPRSSRRSALVPRAYLHLRKSHRRLRRRRNSSIACPAWSEISPQPFLRRRCSCPRRENLADCQRSSASQELGACQASIGKRAKCLGRRVSRSHRCLTQVCVGERCAPAPAAREAGRRKRVRVES